MKVVEKKNRVSILGLVKFIAAVAIVYYHMVDLKSEHWGSLFLLVELFFFITGYFTYKHFDKINDSDKISLEEKSGRAIKYTFNKIKPLVPYIIIAIVLHFIAMALSALQSGTTKAGLLDAVIKSIMDALLLGSQINIDNWALWFISAMAIAMPLFCIICQYRQKYVHVIGFLLVAILFYFNTLKLDVISGIGAIIRAFTGLATGGAIYIITEKILAGNCKEGKFVKILLSILSIGAFMFSFAMMYPTRHSLNSRQCQSLVVIVFVLFMILLMSGSTALTNISSRTMNFLEKISMVLFFIHQPVIQIVLLWQSLDTLQLRGLMVVSCIAISCVLYVLISIFVKDFKKKTKAVIVSAG